MALERTVILNLFQDPIYESAKPVSREANRILKQVQDDGNIWRFCSGANVGSAHGRDQRSDIRQQLIDTLHSPQGTRHVGAK
jgi:hypothetical protein